MKTAMVLQSAMLALLALPVAAQGQTVLHLSASGMVRAVPDEVTAHLQVQTSSATASDAQAQVNRLMATGLAAAHQAAGVEASTDFYSVREITDANSKVEEYLGIEGLVLVAQAPQGRPTGDFMNLIGQLQQSGFLLQSLDGELSDAARANANLSAIANAMANLRSQAETIANSLHETVGQYKDVSVNMDDSRPIFGVATGTFTASIPAPQATPSKINVSANLTATIELVRSK